MIAVEDCVLVLLAAGRSERYGDVDSKLDEPFLTRPLGLHVAVALEDLPFKQRVAVVGRARLDYESYGFHALHNPEADRGISTSVRLGIECAKRHDARAVVIALADMPRVTASHVLRLLDAADGEDAVVASSDGCETKPPAVFGRGQFDFLMSLEGDSGARDLVRGGKHVITAPAELIDVDTPEELEQLRELIHSHEALTRVGTRRFTRDGERRSD